MLGFVWWRVWGGYLGGRYVDVLGLMGTMMSMVCRPEIEMWEFLPDFASIGV